MNNNNQNSGSRPSDSNSDLSWVALCYVANELDAGARRQFEIRLERDQAARDAVVRAFDDARLLDLALDAIGDPVAQPTCELSDRETRSSQRITTVRGKSVWRRALLGIAVVGLLALVLTQLPQGQSGPEIALNTGDSGSAGEITEAAMSLAETWADAEWQADLQVEIADTEAGLTFDAQRIGPPELLEDTGQDDWMISTLIDMAEVSGSPESGS